MVNGVQSTEAVNKFELNNVLRDGVQSNLGTNLSSDEIIDMLLHTTAAEYAEYQIAGGTFMDLFLKKGRDVYGENTKLFNEFEAVITSALIRGDCLTAYTRQPQDVIDAVIEELADRGLNVVTNFHGNNYAPMQEGVFKAVRKAQENGYNIAAPKVLCIEDNPNITIESCMAALAEQDAVGADKGVYLKNASGKVDPDFVYEITKRIAIEYPGQKITLHTHDNHGLADAIYARGMEAAAETNAKIAFDVLPRAMASGTAQPPAWRIQKIAENHPSEAVQARASNYDEAAEEADFEKQYATRHQYGASEVVYDKESWDACYEAGMAGGAMAALKGMGILPTIKGMYGLGDESQALAVVAKIETKVKALFGYPTSVTPFQKTMDEQSALEARLRKDESGVWRENKDGDYEPFSQLHTSAVNYLSGGLGPIPQSADPQLIKMALEQSGQEKIEEFVPADELPAGMDAAKKRLVDAGYEEPTRADVSLVAMFADAAFDEVMIRSGQSNLPQHHVKGQEFVQESHNWITGETKGHTIDVVTDEKKQPSPAQPPELPSYLQKPSEDYAFSASNKAITEYDVATALGGAAELERFALAITELEKHADGFYKTGIGASGFFQRSPEGQGLTKKFSEGKSNVRADVSYIKQIHDDARAEAEAEVAAFMEAIPQKLKEYGMTQKHAAAASFKHVPELLAQVVDKKAKNASQRSLQQFSIGNVAKAFEAEPRAKAANGNAHAGQRVAKNGAGESWPPVEAPSAVQPAAAVEEFQPFMK